MKTIEFDYTVSCGLDGYFVHLEEMPDENKAFEIITEHCAASNTDKSFALKHTWWKEFGESKGFKLSQAFLDSKKQNVQR